MLSNSKLINMAPESNTNPAGVYCQDPSLDVTLKTAIIIDDCTFGRFDSNVGNSFGKSTYTGSGDGYALWNSNVNAKPLNVQYVSRSIHSYFSGNQTFYISPYFGSWNEISGPANSYPDLTRNGYGMLEGYKPIYVPFIPMESI